MACNLIRDNKGNITNVFGNMATLQADVGFTAKVATDEQLDIPGYRPLKFYEFERDGKTVKAMEVYLPHHLKSEYGSEVDINDLSEKAKEIIGFRIPTEGLNSIEFIKIAGFLKPAMGTSIVVPHEMVAKSGADYNKEDNDSSKDSLSYKPANQVDLKKTIKPSIKLLLGTLPKAIENSEGESILKTNKTGVYELATEIKLVFMIIINQKRTILDILKL